MNRDGKDIQTNRGTVEEGSLPGFLGNEGKSKEVSSVFAAILARGCHQGNESQGTVQNHWLDPVEKLAKDNGVWIGKLSSMASVEIGYGHENTVFLSKDGNSVIKFNNLRDIHDKTSLIRFIERINSHNEFSLEAPYTLIGFTKDPDGKTGLLMSQPYIKMAMEADSYTIGEYLKKRGFVQDYLKGSERKGWTNGTYEFSDAVPRNVLMDLQGNLYFIDLQINSPGRLDRYLSEYRKFNENKAIGIIQTRIKDSAAKSFTPEQYQTLNEFVADKETPAGRKAVFDDLLPKAVDRLERYNKCWVKDVQEELDDLANGKMRSQSLGWKW